MSTWYARSDGGTTTQCTGKADAPYTTGTGAACAYKELQDAINGANAENVAATIWARAGDAWDNVTIPARAASSSFIELLSSDYLTIPTRLHGVINTDAAKMAKISTTSNVFAMMVATGAHHWAIGGLEITTATGHTGPTYFQILVEHHGDAVNFFKCWIHSQEDYTDIVEASCRIGLVYYGSNSSISDSRIAYFSAYVKGTTQVDNNFAMVYGGSHLLIQNSYMGAWYDTIISGGSSFAPEVNNVTISGTPTLSGATLSSVTGLTVGELIALRNFPMHTVSCSFVASTRTLTCAGANFNPAYVDYFNSGGPSFHLLFVDKRSSAESYVNSTTMIMRDTFGGFGDFTSQNVEIDGVYGAAKVTGISGFNVTYTPWGITQLTAAPEVPGNVQWEGFVPNNLTLDRVHFHNNENIAAAVHVVNPSQNPKAFWEVKSIEDFLVNGCWFTGYGTSVGHLVANQGTPAGCPSVWSKIKNATIQNCWYNVTNHEFQVMGWSLGDDYYCTSKGGSDVFILNNLITAGGVLARMTSGNNVQFKHNTVINNGGGAQLIQQEAGDSSDDTIGFVYSDNIAINNNYGLHCTYGPGTYGMICYPAAVISKNIFIGSHSTDPWCGAGFDSTNLCLANLAAVKFVDQASNDYRLASDSPGKGAGTGGSDMGVDWTTLVAALGFDPTGGVTPPPPTGAPMNFNKFNSFVEALAEKVHNLGADAITAFLTTNANTPVASNTQLSNITPIAYTNLSSRVLTTSSSAQSGGVYKLIVSDLVLTASGAVATFRMIGLYNDTASLDQLIGWFDWGGDVTLQNGDTLTVDFDGTNGVIEITATAAGGGGGAGSWPTANLQVDLNPELEAYADNATVSTAHDQSGLSRDALMGGVGVIIFKTGIVNGLPVYRFAATQEAYLAEHAGVSSALSGQGEAILVVKVNNDPPSNVTKSGLWHLGTAVDSTHYPYTTGDYYEAALNSVRRGPIDKLGINLAQWALLDVVSTGSELTIEINGVQVFHSTTNTFGAASPFLIGRSADSTLFLDGDVARHAVWSVPLDATTKANMKAYVATKYGITIA